MKLKTALWLAIFLTVFVNLNVGQVVQGRGVTTASDTQPEPTSDNGNADSSNNGGTSRSATSRTASNPSNGGTSNSNSTNSIPSRGNSTRVIRPSNGQPVRLVWISPPYPNANMPFFAINQVVNLTWSYDAKFSTAPKNLSIIIDNPTYKIKDYVVANLSGSAKDFQWDTSNYQLDNARALPQGDGYSLWIYDHRGKLANPVGGALAPYSFAFVAFESTYYNSINCDNCIADGAKSAARSNTVPLRLVLAVGALSCLLSLLC